MKKFFTTFSAIVFCTFIFAAYGFAVPSTTLVISQVNGGGGGTTGTYLFDYVEIKNISSSPQSLSGLSLYYGSAVGQFASTAGNSFALPAVTVNPGQYYFVQTGPTGTAGAAFPVTPDVVTPNLTMSGTSGKVALVTAASLPINTCGATATPCSAAQLAAMVDWVAWGAAGNGAAGNGEGGTSTNAGVAITSSQGSVRNAAGCTDTDNNNLDFAIVTAPVPRNLATPASPCGVVLDITTPNMMPDGKTNFFYTTSFATTGGVAPYSYAVTSGAVPTGLTLNSNGTWSGFPTAAGVFNFDVTVTDSNPLAFGRTFSGKFEPFAPNAPNVATEAFQIRVTTPTAADASIRGRLLTPTGRGLMNATIVLTNTNSGEVFTARSTSVGYFNFRDLESGDFYVLNVKSKRYVFESRSFTLNENIDDMILTAQ
jgi:Lamin Tail Domain/Putative Ig domain/Carboxypeptidase regulatory-like domain